MSSLIGLQQQKKLLLTVAISPLVNFLIKSHVTIKFARSSVSNKRDYWAQIKPTLHSNYPNTI